MSVAHEVRRLRVLLICSHPVQYAAPVFRQMSKHPELELIVAYCSMDGAQAGYDPHFNITVKWDIPLLDGYTWVEVSNLGSGNNKFFGLCNLAIWKLVRKGSFDAVICYTGYMNASFWIAFLAARMSGAAFLFASDANTLAARDTSSVKFHTKQLLWPRLFSLPDQVIVPSSDAFNLVRSLGIAQNQITLTPYPVDNHWWQDEASKVDRAAVRELWNISPDSLVVLFCAKLQSWKRPSDLLRAFSLAAVPNSILVFAGEGPLRSKLETDAGALGIGDRVRFLGFVNQSELPKVYVSSDVLVLPSEYEPFGVVVNEASCCACPVIASDRVGAAKDLIVPVNPSFVFSSGDVATLARLLSSALADPWLLAKRGQAARDRMKSWSMNENIATTVTAIRRAIAQRDGARAGRTVPVVNRKG